jgi:hypothetical protein
MKSSQLLESSQLPTENQVDYGSPPVIRAMMRDLCQVRAELAMEIVEKYDLQAVQQGWCRLVLPRESKEHDRSRLN